jgi:hypothetical protein
MYRPAARSFCSHWPHWRRPRSHRIIRERRAGRQHRPGDSDAAAGVRDSTGDARHAAHAGDQSQLLREQRLQALVEMIFDRHGLDLQYDADATSPSARSGSSAAPTAWPSP